MLGSDRERRVGRGRLGTGPHSPRRVGGSAGVSGAVPPRRPPTPRRAGFADALARPHAPGLPFLPTGTRTRPALGRSPPIQAAGSPPSSAVPRLSPPAAYPRHVTPPPSRPAPPRPAPRPSSRSASRRRAPPTRASLTDDVAGAATLGEGPSAAGSAVGGTWCRLAQREGRVRCVANRGLPRKEGRGKKRPKSLSSRCGGTGRCPAPLGALPEEAWRLSRSNEPRILLREVMARAQVHEFKR